MSAITVRSSCVACGQEISILKCESCWQTGFSNQSVVHCEETNKHSNETKVSQEIVSEEWSKGAKQGSVVVGGNGRGAQPNQLYNCWYLSFDRQGNLYVSDYNNHRIQKFNIAPNSIQ